MRRASAGLVALVLFGIGAYAAAQNPESSGIVVEAVDEGGAGQKAGLRPGDVLIAWERAAEPPANATGARGELRSPFDLTEVEIEQAPRGPLTLSGVRAGEPIVVAISHGRWQVATRPSLAPAIGASYERGRTLAAERKVDEAVASWRAAAAGTDDGVVSAWLLLRASAALRDAGKMTEAQAVLAEGLTAARRTGDGAAIAGLYDAQGQLLQQQRNYTGAEPAYREALATRQGTGAANLGTAKGLSDLAFVAQGQRDPPLAASRIQEAVELLRRLAPDSFAFARASFNAGFFAHSRGDLDAAMPWYRAAVELFERLIPDTRDLAVALGNVGSLAQRRGELATAATQLERALAILERLDPASIEVARSLGNLGNLAIDRGRFADAERFQRRALSIYEHRAPGTLDEATALNNLAAVSMARGDLSSAEQDLLRSLAIRERVAPDSSDVATSLHNLGNLANTRGDPTLAQDYFGRSLAIAERLAPESLNVAQTLNNLGTVAQKRRDFPTAETLFRRALAIKERRAPNSIVVAPALVNLGQLAESRGEMTSAREHYEAARTVLEGAAPDGLMLGTVLGHVADVALALGDEAEADRLSARALPLVARLAPASTEHAVALRRLGRHAFRKGDIDRASTFFARAIDALEAQTRRIGGSAEARTTFAGQGHEFYVEYIDALMAGGQSGRAFDVLERSRARGLLAVLAERDLVLDTDLSPELRQARLDLNEEYDRVQASLADLTPAKDAAVIDRLQTHLRDLRESRARLVDRVRAASPRLAALEYPSPLDLVGVHRALDPGTVLLSYQVGKDATRLFVVQRSRADTATVTAYSIPTGEAPLREQVSALRRLIERQSDGGAPSDAYLDAAGRLFDGLVRPAERHIAAANRVLIVADGPLHSLPFAALVRNHGDAADRSWQYAVEWKPIHTALSATVYAELRKVRSDAAAPVSAVAFGDPRYPHSADATASPEMRGLVRRGNVLGALPFSRNEVEALGRMFGNRARVYAGPDATEARAKAVRSTRYLHFATHGLLDASSPLNSALALTVPTVQREGEDNGLLQAWEIFEQLRLDVDLVTMSACETALGAELAGEGLIGLTRAFHYAGARSVMASLWRVADGSTATLMSNVYRHLKAGVSKDEALRRAQREAIAQPSTAAPFHWAAFTLSGDWR
jgi:CHAT domain-containing protein/Tfp pilus assembly protein PilF